MNKEKDKSSIFEVYKKSEIERQEVCAKLARKMDELFKETIPSLGKQLIEEIEELQEEELRLTADKHRAIDDIVQWKQEKFYSAAEIEYRKSLWSKKSSQALLENISQRSNASKSDGSESKDGSIVEVNWEINLKDLRIFDDRKIGAGQFGTVYKGELLGKEVAVKKLTVQSFKDASIEELEFTREVKTMASLRHPNLLLLMGASLKPGQMLMVTELMSRGSVYSLLHPSQPKDRLPFRTKMTFAKHTVLGMNWLHQQTSLLHLDLKTANLLVDENWIVKVADFGLSQLKRDIHKERVGSPYYMAPEMLSGKGYSQKADVYSFSIVLWELLTEKDPYEGAFTSFTELVVGVSQKHIRPTIPQGTCNKLVELLRSCWHPDENLRPNFSDILKSKVIDDIIIDTLLGDNNPLAKLIWKEKGYGKWQITWEEFQKSFSDVLRIPVRLIPFDDLKYQLMKSVLRADENKNMVTIENFADMLAWFGPLEVDILTRIHNLLVQKFFYGFLTTTKAEQMLTADGKKVGEYLVRFSSSEPGNFSLSFITSKDAVQHLRIVRSPDGVLKIGKNDYANWPKLFDGCHKQYGLKKPCKLPTPYIPLIEAWDKTLKSFGYLPTGETSFQFPR